MDSSSVAIIFKKLEDDYIRLCSLKDKAKDEYMYEFLHGKIDYIENLMDWVSFSQEEV